MDEQINRAKDQIAALSQNQAGLLARREKHGADQCCLWATLAWEQVKDREIALNPLCRFALRPQGAPVAVLRPVVLFLRVADRVAVESLESVKDGQAGTFHVGNLRMDAAFKVLQLALADALDAADLAPERKKQGETLKALCKQITEECKVIDENCANALDRDKAKQDNSKLEFRGQLQASLSKYAVEAIRLDDTIADTARNWGVEADKAAPTPDAVPPAPAIKTDALAAVAAAPAAATSAAPASDVAAAGSISAIFQVGSSWTLKHRVGRFRPTEMPAKVLRVQGNTATLRMVEKAVTHDITLELQDRRIRVTTYVDVLAGTDGQDTTGPIRSTNIKIEGPADLPVAGGAIILIGTWDREDTTKNAAIKTDIAQRFEFAPDAGEKP